MYVKSARIKWYSMSGMADSTLFVTDLPSEVVRSTACGTRKFFPLIWVLNGTKARCIQRVKLHALCECMSIGAKEGTSSLCKMRQIAKMDARRIDGNLASASFFEEFHGAVLPRRGVLDVFVKPAKHL